MSRAGAAFPRWLLALSAAIALSSALPHMWQAATCPDDAVFTGFVEAHNDQNIYVMWCRQVQQGRVLLDNLATAERTDPIFVGPHWLALGALARVVPVAIITIYRILAVVLAFVYLLILWRLMCEVFADDDTRLFAWVIAALGSGFGAVCDAVNAIAGRTVVFSADVMPELWAYHSFRLPHFTVALCAMALLTLFVLRGHRAPSMRLHLSAAAAGLVMTAVHPYDIAVWAPLLVVHAAIVLLRGGAWRQVTVNVSALFGAGLPAAFYVIQSKTHPLLATWAAQNVLRSPTPAQYLIGLGVVLPLAIIGYRAMDHDRRPGVAWFAAAWIAITAVAAYSYPLIPFERRAVEGLHIPLAILAGAAMARRGTPWLERRIKSGGPTAKRAAMMLLLVAILPTNVKLVADGILTDSGRIPRPTKSAFDWIEANTPRDARIFCTMAVGQYCCRYALRHVHAGHLQLTIEPDRKQQIAEEFFAIDTDEARRREILRQAGCGWIVASGDQVNAAAELPWLDEVFAEGRVVVYRFAESPPLPEL